MSTRDSPTPGKSGNRTFAVPLLHFSDKRQGKGKLLALGAIKPKGGACLIELTALGCASERVLFHQQASNRLSGTEKRVTQQEEEAKDPNERTYFAMSARADLDESER